MKSPFITDISSFKQELLEVNAERNAFKRTGTHLICPKKMSPWGDSLSDTLESYVGTLGNNLLMTGIQYCKKPLFIILTIQDIVLYI